MKAFNYQFTAYNPVFATHDNEAIYNGLCAATIPMDAGLAELRSRLKPIIINAATDFLRALTWTLDDALDEALILLWDLVRKHSYKTGAPFHSFFARSWQQKLCSLFQKAVLKGLVYAGDSQMGWAGHQPVYMMVYTEHEKAAHYREAHRQRNARYYQRIREQKLAEGVEAQPKRPCMTPEERSEKNRQSTRAWWASLTPEQKAKHNARSAERRKQKRANETPEEREARCARRRERDQQRKKKD